MVTFCSWSLKLIRSRRGTGSDLQTPARNPGRQRPASPSGRAGTSRGSQTSTFVEAEHHKFHDTRLSQPLLRHPAVRIPVGPGDACRPAVNESTSVESASSASAGFCPTYAFLSVFTPRQTRRRVGQTLQVTLFRSPDQEPAEVLRLTRRCRSPIGPLASRAGGRMPGAGAPERRC